MAKKKRAGGHAPANLPGKSPNMRNFYLALAAVAVAGLAWIGWTVMNRGSAAALDPIVLTGIEDPQTLLRQAQGVSLGQPEGENPVQVLVFSDFTCPACQRFTQFVEPLIKSEFVNTGLIRFVYYDYPLGGTGQHRYGFLAGRAARCAGDQQKFWEYHDLLFGRQNDWSYERNPPIDTFIEYSRLLGLDARAFRGCLESDRHADVVTANRVLGDQLGVQGTPTVFVGGRSIAQWSDFRAVRDAIQRELGMTS